MPFDPTDPKYASPLAAMAQERMTGMLNQPQMKVFAAPQQDGGTVTSSPIMPGQNQLNQTMGMAKGGHVNDELSGIKDTIRKEFAARGLDFDRFISNPAVMDEVGKSLAAQGKDGDTILAHINPKEAETLKRMGGSGTVNPSTGLLQFAEDSSSSNQSPSYSGGSYSNYTGGSDIGGYSGSGNTTYSTGGGGTTTSSTMGGSLSTSGGGGSTISRPISKTPSTAGAIYKGSTASQTSVSPTGVTGGSISMGTPQPSINETIGAKSTFSGVDPMSGIPIGGASDIYDVGQFETAPSNLAQLAIGPSYDVAPIVAAPSNIDLGNTAPTLSDISFSNIDTGMYSGATIPGGVSNYATSPEQPGYTDLGVTAMRMAAGMPGGEGYRSQSTEFNLGKLNEFDPVSQTQGATILNRLMDRGYEPGFDPYGVGRTMAQQAALYANAGGNLTAAPGRSMHNFGLAMDVENLPEQGYQDLSKIAKEEGWGWGGSQDPAHVQMAPWGASAVQTAQRLGASPFTGSNTSVATGTSPLKEALNTVSNIANELFGVKSAAAETSENAALQNLFNQTDIFGGEEPMSPFIGGANPNMAFPPQSQQQMLDALGIAGRPITAEELAQAAQVAGSGVYPSYSDLGVLPPGQKYQDRAPGAESISKVGNYFSDIPGISSFGYPQDFGLRNVAVGDITPALSSFDISGPVSVNPSTPEAIIQTTQTPFDISNLPIGQYGTFDIPTAISQYREALNNVTVPSGTILGNVTAGPYVNNPSSEYYQTDEQMAQTIMNNLPLAGLTIGPNGTIVNQDGSMATPEQMASVINLASRAYTVPQSKMPEGSTGQITLDPRQFVNVSNIPLPPERIGEVPSYGAISPQETGLSGFESALNAAPSATPPLGGIAPIRAEVPSQSSTRMTSEQLKDLGIYKEPLQPGQTVRENFNEAYADATKSGIDVFEWTNPATGKTEVYKSGASDADIPAKGAKTASGEVSTNTEYEKTISALEDAGQIANGMTKEEYAAAMGVPVDEVKSRITSQFGPPMVEYYTKSIGESLAGITGNKSNMEGIFNLLSMTSPMGILSILGKNVYNQLNSDTSSSPLTSSASASSSGGGGGNTRISTAPSTGKKSILSKTPTVENKAPDTTPKLSNIDPREFIGLPIDYANYGYGGEHTYYTQNAAKGGRISALSAMRKN